MKLPKTVWLMIAVVAVWGTIGYRIYSSLGEEDETEIRPWVRKTAHVEASRENYPLLLNYSDPFLKKAAAKEKPKAQQQAKIVKPAKPVSSVPVVMVDWSKIEYVGSIYNASRKTTIATLRFNGKEYAAREGESVNEFKILSVKKDSCQLSFSGQTKYIKRSK
jgi:hypothetical protein